MKKIKDILYDTNDILVALIIICMAAFIIYTRVDSIMGFPARMAEEGSGGSHIRVTEPAEDGQDAQEPDGDTAGAGADGDTASNDPDTPVSSDEQSGEGQGSDGQAGDGQGSDGQEGSGVSSLFIGYGQSMDEVAQNLINLGFFSTKDEFYVALEERGASTKVQAGNFIIPSDATTDELIEIITKPGM